MRESDLIKQHMEWLDGEMPSQKTYEKDFSAAPIYHLYIGRKDSLARLWSLSLKNSPTRRKMLLDELCELLKFIEGS